MTTSASAQSIDPATSSRPPESTTRADLTAALLERAHAERHRGRRRQLLDEVVLANRSVAEGVAHRFRNRGIAQEDLHQVAYEGLTKAVLRFDPSMGHDLLTYAVPMIRGELQRHLRDQGWSVRPPRRVQQLQRCIVDCAEGLTQGLGREPLDMELMAELGVESSDYQEAVAAFGCKRATSLDQPVGLAGDESLGSLVAVEDRDAAATEARLVLGPALQILPERDRDILYLRFFEDLTQREIGERLGVTQMQVSRLLTQILARLHAHVARDAA
jgi:RNA polymerase sigma-B factor